MDGDTWTVKSHVIPASHIRGYSRGVRDEKAGGLRLAVNQYTPKKPPASARNPVSIIFIHGVGSTKESYEPFFARLLDAGVPIRSIWAPDIAWHG
jgi:pimeloyl-ACP methyl ester carboxylesterase